MTSTETWVCSTCRADVGTRFCSACGESRIPSRDLTVRGVLDKLLHALTDVDGRLMRTFWQLLRHPGRLTVVYMEGVRKSYTPPLQLFLVANVVFFAMQSLTGTNILGSSLESHLHHQDWSAFAQSLLKLDLERTHTSLESYAPVFDRAVVLNAKSLVILMVIPFTALLALVYWRTHEAFMGHVVFSLHLYAFLLLLLSFAVLAAGIYARFGGADLSSPGVDNALSIFNFAMCAAYLYVAMGPAYSARGGRRLGEALVLTAAVGAIVLGYRFVLLPITLYGA